MEMKKSIFGTLCVSALLVACTDNELVTLTPDNGEGEKIEVKIGAKYSDFTDEAGTRMELIGTDWAWVNGDMLGACRVGAVDAQSASATVSSNYPFVLTKELTEPVKNASFKTNTAVFAGKYVFYHQYNGDLIGEAASADDKFNVEFPAVQVVDPAKPTAHITSQNIWISPVITLGGIKYNAENETALEFTPLNGVMKLNIKNSSTEGDLVINKVEVVGEQFPVKGNLDFATANTFPVLNASDADYATELSENVAKMQKVNTSTGIADLLASGATKDGTKISAVLTGEGLSLKSGAEEAVYVLIPGGIYDIDSKSSKAAIKSFNIYTNKGKFIINAEDARKGANKGKTVSGFEFNRSALNNMYPELTGKADAAESYDINNIYDWNNAVKYADANKNKTIEFVLKDNLEVSSLPAFAIYVTGDKELQLAAGKEFSVVGGSYFQKVTNNGTLNLADNVYVGTLTNKGTVNVSAIDNVKSVATTTYTAFKQAATKSYGVFTLSNQGALNLNGKMTKTSDGTWNNTKAVENVSTLGTITIAKDAVLTIGSATTNEGTIENKGTINVVAAVLTNAADATINVATATGKFVGAQNKITNNGTINLDAAKDVFMDENGKAVDKSFVTAASTGNVEVAIAPKDIATLPAIQEVNSIKMSGAWNQEMLSTLTTKWTGITAQTWDAVTVDLKEVTTEFNNVKTLTINGTSAINNSGTDAVELGLAATSAASAVTVNGDLTIAEKVTVGKEKTNSPEITVLGSVTNNGSVFANLTIGADKDGSTPANTSALFTNNEKATVDVVSAYSNSSYTYAALNLYGKFVNNGDAAKVNVAKVDFKIKGQSTYTGTYTTKP